MDTKRPWYKEPETFIAVAALVVSLSAVVVGIYEAQLQRAHDRAEVWPHVELTTITSQAGATIAVENGGIGPAVMKSMVVTVDGTPRKNWPDAVQALLGRPAGQLSSYTVVDQALRAGDKRQVLVLDSAMLPAQFWPWIARVGVTICYSSVFGESWILTSPHLGDRGTWRSVEACPAQPPSVDF